MIYNEFEFLAQFYYLGFKFTQSHSVLKIFKIDYLLKNKSLLMPLVNFSNGIRTTGMGATVSASNDQNRRRCECICV